MIERHIRAPPRGGPLPGKAETFSRWRGCRRLRAIISALGRRHKGPRDGRGLGKPFQAVAVADFAPTDVDIDPGMDPVAVAAAWACMIGSDTPHQRARLIERQPAEDDLTQRLQAAISSD